MELHNWHITLIGWFVWNVGLLSLTKDEYDDSGKDFLLKSYAKDHWDNWLFSLVAIPAILIAGSQGFGMDALAVIDIKMKWSNLYYLGSGFFAESAKYSYKKWRKKKQSE